MVTICDQLACDQVQHITAKKKNRPQGLPGGLSTLTQVRAPQNTQAQQGEQPLSLLSSTGPDCPEPWPPCSLSHSPTPPPADVTQPLLLLLEPEL